MKVVSACLAGVRCRYDGSSRTCAAVEQMLARGEAVPVCPEQLGGLPTPRSPAEQRDGGVFTKDGQDVTVQFKRGALEALGIAQKAGCKEAILKSRSPSCGVGQVYGGSFSGKLVPGDGVFAALLKKTAFQCAQRKGSRC